MSYFVNKQNNQHWSKSYAGMSMNYWKNVASANLGLSYQDLQILSRNLTKFWSTECPPESTWPITTMLIWTFSFPILVLVLTRVRVAWLARPQCHSTGRQPTCLSVQPSWGCLAAQNGKFCEIQRSLCVQLSSQACSILQLGQNILDHPDWPAGPQTL